MDSELINSFLSKVAGGDNTGAKDDFENLISQKLNAAIDAKKAEVAQSIYGQSEVEDQGEVESESDPDDETEEPEEETVDAA